MTDETMINSDPADVEMVEEGHPLESWPSSARDPGNPPVALSAVKSPQTSPGPPADLREAGIALWRAVVDRYETVEHERILLAEAARSADLTAALDEQIRADGLMLRWGPEGQQRANPLLARLMDARALTARLLAALRVPVEEDDLSARSPRGFYATRRP